MASTAGHDKRQSKDGTVQRRAKEVEGLRDYQLNDCLGRGAFGSVYRAFNWSNGETVAIKQIRLADLPKAELTTITQEIELLKNLQHPNIVKYHGSVRDSNNLYIILEFCENGSLHSICKNFGKFPENLVSLYTAQVLRGLLFLHDQAVIHRDIKGANILTTKEGLVKLADFGVATKQTGLAEGSVVGTPYWMAPEVIELSGATTASDIWSLGCTVIELLDGKPPYHKLAPMPALFRIVNDDHPPLPEGASPLVRDFLMQCFQKDPNLRVSAKKLLKHPWIVSTKKKEVHKPTEYDEAVKSVQEWNEALKASPPNAHAGNVGSRRSSTRPASRPDSRGVTKPSNKKHEQPPSLSTSGIQRPESRKAQGRQLYLSPEEYENRDIWDDDFESLSTNLAALQLPDRLKPHDNFAGMFSSEKLKQYASYDSIPDLDGKVEEWDEEFEGDLTVRSPLTLSKGNAIETVRPFYPSRASSDEIKHQPPSRLAPRKSSRELPPRRASKDSQPRTQILRPVSHKATASLSKHNQSTVSNRTTRPVKADKDMYREDDEEDYSDLVPADDDAFQQKIAAFSPSRPFNANDLRKMQQMKGSVRRRTLTPTNLVHDAAAIRRSRSSLEIQKYAEVEDDEDFTELCFGDDDGAPIHLQPVKTRSPKSASAGSESNAGSERGTMKISGSSSWMLDDEEEDEDDPFAALEEELDEVDLEENVARDKYARLCTLVEGLVADLKLGQPDDVLGEIVDQLLQILSESPDLRSVIVSSHGMLPILEILDTCTRPHTILRLLKIVNTIVSPSNVEVQENLCFVGGIPIVSKFAHKKYSSDIRLEAAAFVKMMYLTSTLTLQMFVSCGGLNVLVEFLEEDYDSDVGRELVLVGVNGVWSVFELQGPTPKNDFCRIFSRSSVLYPLSLVLNRVLDEDGEQAEVVEGRIVNIFLLFSQAENHVKESVADRMVLKTVLKDLKRMSPQHQITMLKFIKNLSMLATTLDALQNSNAIEVLTDLLGANMHAAHFREISNQVLNTMYNLCRLSKARQEDAALNGVIPLLQRIVKTERPLKEFALPILCDMAHSGKVGRKVLWQNKGLHFYVSLLADQYWAVTALDAIFIWLQEETAKVEEHLLRSDSAFSAAVLQCFNESKADAFENLLEPLQKMLRLSPPIAASLAHKTLFERTAVKVHAKKPLVRLNLLRVIRSICDASEEQGALIIKYGLADSVKELARHDPAILVREMANDLVRSSELVHASAARLAGMRRSSISTMTPPAPLLPSSSSGTPIERAGSRGGYFELGMELDRSRPAASSLYRPISRGTSSSSCNVNVAAPVGGRSSRLGSRQNTSRAQSRLSLMPTANATGTVANRAGENMTPTHAPPSANTRSSMAANARRRRQTSGAELGR
jgi:serine/threonine protein kinase